MTSAYANGKNTIPNTIRIAGIYKSVPSIPSRFRNTLAAVSGAIIELSETDGSVGAAKGAGIGCGIYKDNTEAFASLKKLAVIEPDQEHLQQYLDAYAQWKERLATVVAK